MLASVCLVCCKNKSNTNKVLEEDKQAKSMLQGIWVNDDEENVAFRAKGDSIFYPDTTSMPVRFYIRKDTLYLQGANTVKYKILKQKQYLFEFKNQNGEIVTLTKSSDADDMLQFEHKKSFTLNQNQLIKRDTVVKYSNEPYHCYVQINPTTYKVLRSTYNDDGVEVDNIYYDNIIHLGIYRNGVKIFSRDFSKQNFSTYAPAQFIKQGILSDMTFDHIDAAGIYYNASICMPDEASSYIVKLKFLYNGKMDIITEN